MSLGRRPGLYRSSDREPTRRFNHLSRVLLAGVPFGEQLLGGLGLALLVFLRLGGVVLLDSLLTNERSSIVCTLMNGDYLAPPPGAAIRVTAHMGEVAERSRNGETDLGPTSPSEMVDETFRAAYITPAQQNSMDSRAGRPLRYPEPGKSPAMDATIHLQWEMPHIGKLPDTPG